MSLKRVIIIGGGNMGLAIANGISQNKLVSKKNIIFIEKKPVRISYLKKKGFIATSELAETIAKSKSNIEAIILAVKPADFNHLMSELNKSISKSHLLISILAGVKIKTIESKVNKKQPIARVMPNTPCQIGEGISALTFNKNIKRKEKETVKNIFSAIGKTIELNENKFDLVTAVSGSGPAYFSYFIESVIASCNKLGLSETLAKELTTQTAIGTLLLLSKKGLSPEELRIAVTSPNGTTEAALKVFEKQDFSKIIHSAIKSAMNRSVELGRSKQ